MSDRTFRTPSYACHKPTGQAVVTINGRDFYPGLFGSPGSRAEFDREDRRMALKWPSAPVPGLIRGGGSHGERAGAWPISRSPTRTTSRPGSRQRSRPPFGFLSDHSANSTATHWPGTSGLSSSRPFARRWLTLAFVATKSTRERGGSRDSSSGPSGRDWSLRPSIIQAVTGLRRGRSDVRESEPVKPVPDAFVDAIQPYHVMHLSSDSFRLDYRVGPDANPRSLRNFPCQANGAEMLRLACCLATERGVNVVAPVHDASIVEGPPTRLMTLWPGHKRRWRRRRRSSSTDSSSGRTRR